MIPFNPTGAEVFGRSRPVITGGGLVGENVWLRVDFEMDPEAWLELKIPLKAFQIEFSAAQDRSGARETTEGGSKVASIWGELPIGTDAARGANE